MKRLLNFFAEWLVSKIFQPGGGGTEHHSPKTLVPGEPLELEIAFSVWGAGSGRLDQRYTEVTCLYWINKSPERHRLQGKVLHADKKSMTMQFVIPPLELNPKDRVKYEFHMLFDGHKNKQPGGILKVRPPIAP